MPVHPVRYVGAHFGTTCFDFGLGTGGAVRLGRCGFGFVLCAPLGVGLILGDGLDFGACVRLDIGRAPCFGPGLEGAQRRQI